jgi:hypothetical protein
VPTLHTPLLSKILFVFEDKKIRLQAILVEGIYDVYENDIYLEAMTENEVCRKFNI